jgi:polysaccharide export outer membrane protein
MRYFLKFALLFWMAVPLALAQAPKADTTRADTTKADTTKADTARVETILGPGDVVRATVFQNPDLTVESRISESGQINFPLIGAVTVGGLAIPAAEKRIETLLRERGFVLRPQVTIQVVRTLSSQVSVLGQVGKPGRYPIEMTSSKVSEMIAGAGGVVPGGADVVTLVGTRNGEPVKLDIDLPAILQSGRAELDVQVENGDIIYVDRAPTIYIYGEVQRPGQIRLERGMTLMQVLAAAGGLSARGTERGIKVHRRDTQGQVIVLELKPTDHLQRDDVVYVKESLF